MNHRSDGGHVPVWERSELTPEELARWSCLATTTGRALLDSSAVTASRLRCGQRRAKPAGPSPGTKTPARPCTTGYTCMLSGEAPGHPPGLVVGEPPQYSKLAQSETWSRQFTRLDDDEGAALGARIPGAMRPCPRLTCILL